MARRHTLIRIAIAGTVALWAATIASAVTEVGNNRLHLTLLTGSFLAAVATLTMLKMLVIDARLRVVAGELHDAVSQAADELHSAVAETGEVLRQDRQAIVAVRALTAELVAAREQEHKKVA
ncbi:hypothetical protein [Nonomuraea sp. NPDC005650]|uniref:hypothetical protein n=1 Tax=Nonomuraea sp. NPDC005650 TaxID=3157045 RepID=UPI0033B6ABFB